MSFRSKAALPVAAILITLCPYTSHAQVECWAPGMDSSITLTENRTSQGVSLGKPYRYDVFGVAGTLSLGNRARGAVVSNAVFKQSQLLGIIGTSPTVESTGYVMLQTGLLKTYPEKLSVRSSQVGATVGPVQQYGQNWTLCDPKNPADVNLTFHLSGSSLLGLLEPAYCNLNPKGHFYVLGEYHKTAPIMTGTLGVSTDLVLAECPITLTYGITRYDAPIYRPPFLGVDLGDVNLTVLGTPPESNASHSSGGTQATVRINPSQVSVTIDLNASEGTGWAKTTVTP